MIAVELPPRDEMIEAFLAKDPGYDGVFFTGVRTTGIFCRPTCPAKKPRPENLEFFVSPREALFAGYRPCKRCRPLRPPGTPPGWLQGLLDEVERDPARRWRDRDLEARGMSPERVRRWFQKHHDMTFHAYCRARRLGLALGRIRHGESVMDAAFEHGYESLSGFNEAFRQLLGGPPTEARDAALVTINRIPTPLGPMVAGATSETVCLLEFADRRMLERQLDRMRRRLGCKVVPGSSDRIDDLASELAAYFDGRLERFTVPVEAPGSEFQERVWDELRRIPSGQTVSYGEVARRVGRPRAVRAVARAVGDNRVAILIPCHRVVGSDGRLTGYAGGLWRKRRLLEIEGALLPS